MVEQAYAKTGRFKRFIKSLSAVKVREVMRPAGCLPAACAAQYCPVHEPVGYNKVE
jgi:hypothetical protein